MRKWLFGFIAVLVAGAAPVSAEKVFFGNLHSHTSYSDGSGTPDEAFAMAETAGLDFFAITEHNHKAAEDGAKDRKDGLLIATDPTLYNGKPNSVIASADRHNSGTFVALYGQEFSTISSGNHMNVFDVPDVIVVPNGQYDQLAAWAATAHDSSGRAPLMQMNHPEDAASAKDYGRDDFASAAAWVAAMDPLVELIEVLNAPALKDGAGFRAKRKEATYLGYLNLGFHAAPSTGHDNHYKNWGVSTAARVAVIADRLTKSEVMAALRARHAYATEDRNLRVIYRANGALGGDIVTAPAAGSMLNLTVSIHDDDEPTAKYRVEVLADLPGGAVATVATSVNVQGDTPTPLTLPGIAFKGRGEYVLLRVTQTNAPGGAATDRVWTAPVWFE